MLTKFWEGLGSKLAERWVEVGLTPAFLFWVGGAGAWLYAHGWTRGWQSLTAWVSQRSGAEQVILAVAGLLLILASGTVVKRLTAPTIRFLEGYWPKALRSLRDQLVRWRGSRLAHAEDRWQELAAKIDAETATPAEREDYVRVDRYLRQTPSVRERRMPTRLGDVLRAAESWPGDKYGLDAVKCWARLWLVLPETTRKELIEARASLDVATTAWLWGLLFTVWTFWAWWAMPAGLAVAAAAYNLWILSSAEVYGELFESAFDLHRSALYAALHWPSPQNPAEERQTGAALTQYLWRGSDKPEPEFTGKANDV